MHRHAQRPRHYELCSVGALMDPGFLRGAVGDANGERRFDAAVRHRALTAAQAWVARLEERARGRR